MIFRIIAAMLLCASVAMGQNQQQVGWWRSVSAPRITGGGVISYGNAVDLDGSSEYLSDTNATLTAGMKSFSISAWINLSRLTGSAPRGILSHRSVGGGELLNFDFVPSNNSIRTVCWIGNTAGSGYYNYSYSLSNAFATATWYHVAATCITGTTAITYINGVTNWSSRFFEGTPDDTKNNGGIRQTTRIRIGYGDRDTLDTNRIFAGAIDELVLYKDRVLTAGEISDQYAAGVGFYYTNTATFTSSGLAVSNSIVRAWHFDETGSSTTAVDSAFGTVSLGTGIGSGDWITGKVRLP